MQKSIENLICTHEILENWSKKQRLVKNAVFPLLHMKSFFPSLHKKRIQILVKFHLTSEKD